MVATLAAAVQDETVGDVDGVDRDIRKIEASISNLTDLRIQGHIGDDEFLRRKRDLEFDLAAVRERRESVATIGNWIEPAELLISFHRRALEWYERGDDMIRQQIIGTLGSNLVLTERKLSGDAVKPFALGVKEPTISYWCGQEDDVRTSIEPLETKKTSFQLPPYLEYIRTQYRQNDPVLLKLIDQVRAVVSMAEEAGLVVAHPPLVVRGRAPKKDPRTRGIVPLLPRTKAPRRARPQAGDGSARSVHH